MSDRTPPRSPSPSEAGRRSSTASSSPCIRSRLSSSRSSRLQRRRSSAASSVQLSQEGSSSDAIWNKTQQEWEALKRLAVRRREQDAWVQLLRDERRERLAIAPDMTSRRSSVAASRAVSAVQTSPEDSTPAGTTASAPPQEAEEPPVPQFVSNARDVTQAHRTAVDGTYRLWRYGFRGIFIEAKNGASLETKCDGQDPLEASCCFCFTRRTNHQ